MKTTVSIAMTLLLLSARTFALITYDDGEYNILDFFLDDAVVVMDDVADRPTTLEIASGGNIYNDPLSVYGASKIIVNDGNTGGDVHAYNSSEIFLNSGRINGYLNLNNYSTCVVSGGSTGNMVSTYDYSILIIDNGHLGGVERDLLINNFSKVYLNNGDVARHAYVKNDACLEVCQGSIGGSLHLNNNSTLIMRGGSVGQYLYAEDTSALTISGGWIDRTMYVRHNAEITIMGRDFNYPLGYIDNVSGTLTGTLANGDPIDIDFVREGNGAILLANPNIADFNFNGSVNLADFAILASYWADTECALQNNCEGADFEPDGDVDIEDLVDFSRQWLE